MKYIMITVISAAVIVLLLFFILLFVSSRVFGRGKPYDITKALRKNPELAEEILAKRKSLGKYSPEEVSVKHSTVTGWSEKYIIPKYQTASLSGDLWCVCTDIIRERQRILPEQLIFLPRIAFMCCL